MITIEAHDEQQALILSGDRGAMELRTIALPWNFSKVIVKFALAALLLSQTGVAGSVSIHLDDGAFKVTRYQSLTPRPR